MTRFAHNLALLYRNGVALPQALELVGGVVGSPRVTNAIREVRSRVMAGTSLSEAMQLQRVFPSLLIRLVSVGERTGQLDQALEQVAGHYQELLPRQLKRVLGLLEPSLILGLVLVVGTVALAVILPVLSLMQGLR
jgi:type IV pilus assembly protein PilC